MAMEMNVQFRTRHQWIERLGDAFLIVSPNLMVLHIANAELNYQVLHEREKVRGPAEYCCRYGVHMLWLGETIPENMDASLAKFSSLTAPAGYQVGFLDAAGGVLHHII
ncbi:hypothetical protein NHJ13734_004097 [Beauveria thailandica]